MGLKLVEEQPTGLSGEYWRITRYEISLLAGQNSAVYLSLYKDKTARDNSKTALKSVLIEFDTTLIDVNGDIVTQCYELIIKPDNRWATAEDVKDE